MSTLNLNPPSVCRVCLKISTNAKLILITTACSPTNPKESIKDKLLSCVPSLKLSDENKICRYCLNQLKATCRFIKKCLEAESVYSSGSQSVAEDKDIIKIAFDNSFASDSNTASPTKVKVESNDADCFQDDDDAQQYLLEDSQNSNDVSGDISQADLSLKDTPLDLHAVLDFVPAKLNFISASMELSSQQKEDMLKVGINTIDMSTKQGGKKRVIYLARNYIPMDYNCAQCDVKFTSSADVTDHISLHEQNRILGPETLSFNCDHCFRKFSDEETLRIHLLVTHNISYSMFCSRCKKKFKSLGGLLKHKEAFKNFDKCAYKCPKCTKEFQTQSSLEAHLKSVADAPSCNFAVCKVCSVKFTKEDFKEHCKIHPSYLCSHCGKSLPSSASLHTHTALVHKSTSQMCHECGKILKSRGALRHHIHYTHLVEQTGLTYFCDQCPRTFKYKQKLRYHIAVRHSDQPPQIKCPFCPKFYTSNGQLRAHIKLIHEPPKRFECNMCGEKFSRKDYLNRHMKRHDVYSQFTCSICKISFSSASRLSAHENLGHDENGKALNYGRGGRGNGIKGPRLSTKDNKYNKPCICKICHKVVANKKNLLTHYKTHLRIREKKCEICGLIMANAGSYSKHKKLHEDPDFDKRCRICYITKSTKLELLEHMRTTHKHLKHECKYCGKRFGRKHLLYSHENLEHKEATERKKEALDIINKEPVYVPEAVISNSRKGIKLVDFHSTDVDQLITKISHGETIIQNSSEIYPENFNILNEEFQVKEEERVCTELVEEVILNYQYEDTESLS